MFKLETISDDERIKVLSELCSDPKRVVLKDVYPDLKKKGIYISIVSILPELGYNLINQVVIFKKLLRIDEKIESAFNSGFYLEWLSLLLIKAEFWLRVYLYNHNRYSNMNVLTDELSFGAIIGESRNAGMKKEIIKKLQRLNKWRIQYIHNYLKRDFEYDCIKAESVEFNLAVKELMDYCFETSMRILDNADDLDQAIGFVRFVRFRTK